MKQTSIVMLVVPLRPVKSQTLSVVLANQDCKINVYQKSTGLYLDLFVGGKPLINGLICRDRISMTAKMSMGFVGDLSFKDLIDGQDPYYTGLGSRFILIHQSRAPGF